MTYIGKEKIRIVRNIITYMFSLIEVGSILFIPWGILSKRLEKRQGLSLLPIFVIVGAAANCFINVSLFIKPLLLILLLGIFCEILFQEKFYIKMFYSVMGVYIVTASEMLMANIIYTLPEQFVLSLLGNVLIETLLTFFIKVTVIACGIVFIRYINKLQPKLPAKYWYILSLMYIALIELLQLCMFLGSNLKNSQSKPDNLFYVIIISYALLIIGVGILYFLGKICWVYQKQAELELFQFRSSELDKVVAYQEHVASELKNIRHDIKRHMTNVSYFLDNQQVANAKDYIYSLDKRINEVKPVINSGNYIVDSIMSKYAAICSKKGIKLIMNIDEVSQLNISPVDISAIVDNLLDNAIEAVMECNQEHYIQIKYFSYKGGLVIKIQNPHNGKQKFQMGKMITNKNELTGHGYGLKSIKSTVERCDGDFKYYIEKEMFTTIVILPLKLNK